MSSVELISHSLSDNDNLPPQDSESVTIDFRKMESPDSALSVPRDFLDLNNGELPVLLSDHISDGSKLMSLDDQQDPPKSIGSESLSDQQEQASVISDKHSDSIQNQQKSSDGISREPNKKLPDSQQEPLPITEKLVNNVSFHDIEYTVKSHFTKKRKTILHSVRLD